MSFLQRRPLDVSTSVFCGTRAQAIWYWTTQLFEKADTARPYAGLILRNTVAASKIDELTALHDQHRAGTTGVRTAFNDLSFLSTLQAAAETHWERSPFSHFKLGALSLQQFLTNRIDVAQYRQGRQPEHTAPSDGPLTIFMPLTSSEEYTLAVTPVEYDSPEDLDKFQRVTFGLRRISKVTVHPGDLLVITNQPPTMFSGEAAGSDRLTAVYSSKLHMVSA